jgi:membrane AbrB-like protein
MLDDDEPPASKDTPVRRILDLNRWRAALTILVGATGGGIFYILGLPLAWMLGSMSACVLFLLAGGSLVSVKPLRDPWVVIIGLTLGSKFQFSIFDGDSPYILALILVSIVSMATLNTVYLRTVAKFDKATAFFGGMPGGLYEMTYQGEKVGGDVKTIALLQGLRLFLIVMVVPLGCRAFGIIGDDASVITLPSHEATLWDYAIMVLCGLAGWPLGRLLRLPNAPLLGTTLLTSIVHGLGWMEGAPPAILLMIAQVIVGSAIGGQFIGVTLKYLATTGKHGIPLLLLNLLVMFVLASAMTMVVDRPFISMILILAPGGLTEMSLLALAIGIDVAFVAFHQVFRLFIVQMLGPKAYRLTM